MITLPIHRALPFLAAALWLSPAACTSDPPAAGGAQKDDASASAEAGASPEADTTKAEADTSANAETPDSTGADPAAPAGSELDALLAWLAPDPLAVNYDRLDERLDAATVGVVFALPPKSTDLLVERETLDEALDIVLDGDAEPANWLGAASLAFTVALSKNPYFIRPLTKDRGEVGPLLEAGGFTKNVVEEVEIWLPSGSFPWRIALLDGGMAAFIPVDVPGAGLEPLSSAQAAPPSAIETEISRAINEDPQLEMVLVSAGPLVHYDTNQPIAQVQFGLRKVPLGAQHGYDGQTRLAPTASADTCAEELRARSHPEENAQVQALMKEVTFVVDQGTVVAQLGVQPEQIKHLLSR